jgi:hypothetical protein
MNGERLSEEGQARREAMLGALRREVAARGRRRLAVRAGAGVAAVALLAAGSVVLVRGLSARGTPAPNRIAEVTPPPPPPTETPTRPAPTDAIPAPVVVADASPGSPRILDLVPRIQPGSASLIRPMTADGSIVARAHDTTMPRIADASDESLARGLRAAGIAAGVARVGDRVIVAPDRAAGEG